MPADLTTLAARTEREPPSRELEAEIAFALGLDLGQVNGRTFRQAFMWWMETGDDIDGLCRHWNVPRWLTSLDAAASAMPEGIEVVVVQFAVNAGWLCRALRGYKLLSEGNAPTEPQARTAAALRAQEAAGG